MTSAVLSNLTFVMTTAAVLVAVSACSNQSNPKSVESSDKPSLFQERSIGRFGLRNTKKIALTYDDGPEAPATGQLLDYLKQEGVKATFFNVGMRVRLHPDLMKRMSKEGHVIGNHTDKHEAFNRPEYVANPKLSVKEVYDAHVSLKPYIAPTQKHLYFRAPEGAHRWYLASLMNSVKLLRDYIAPVFWDAGGEIKVTELQEVDGVEKEIPLKVTRDNINSSTIRAAADWHCWALNIDVKTCALGYEREIEELQGGVVLMHALDSRSVALSKILIPWLKRQGYEFITLDQMENLSQYEYSVVLKADDQMKQNQDDQDEKILERARARAEAAGN